MLAGKKGSLKYFRQFGSLCYVLNPFHLSKFDERGKESFLVGCIDSCYLIADLTNDKITISNNVRFTESRVYGHIRGYKPLIRFLTAINSKNRFAMFWTMSEHILFLF